MNKPLPKAGLIGLIVGAGLVVLLAGWLLAVRPLGHKAATLRTQEAAVYQQIAANIADSAPASAASAPKIQVADVYRLAKAMPSITDMPDILLELDQTARAAGVQLQSVSPSEPTDGTNGYADVNIGLSVTGDFYTVTDLLYRLRNLVYVRNGALQANGRLFSVSSANLTPLGTGKSLSATISLDTYVYGVSAPPASTPTSTSTTSTTETTTTTSSSGPSAAGATP